MNKFLNFLSGDKVTHYLLCFYIFIMCYVFFVHVDLPFPKHASASVTVLLSIGKEVWDEVRNGGTDFSWADLLFDMLGIVTGVLITP